MSEAEPPLLELEGVRQRFGRTLALDDVSLAVRAGTTLGVVGESGSGKTTVARVVVGLERPREGVVRFRGSPYPRGGRDLRRLRRQVAMIFQDPYDSLDPRFTLRHLIDEPLRAQGLPRGDDRLAELLRSVGMEGASLDSYPAEYSGGQRQRIGIARALASEPDLLVCDEPTSALDVSVQAQILNLLLDLQRERGLTYLFISHDLDVVRRMSDELVVMHQGRVIESGPTATVCEEPSHPHTRALLGAAPVAHPAQRAAPPTQLSSLSRT
jgi:ABC-type glutathione transport system ATPase component